MAIEDHLHPWLDAYFRSPQWIKNSLGRTYAALAPLARGRHHGRFARQAALQDAAAVAGLATDKLRDTLSTALTSVPAYRAYRHLLPRLERPLEVLAQLPVLSKERLRAHRAQHVSTASPPQSRMQIATGGSTATPMRFYLEKGLSRAREHAFIESFQRRLGQQGRSLVLALRGRSVPGAGTPDAPLWMIEPIKNELIFSTDHLGAACMPDYVAAMRRWQPAWIHAYPSAIMPLARWLQTHPAPDVSRRVRGILLFSENVLDCHRVLLQEVFDCPVLQHYGQSERLLMAGSMPGDPRYFFYPHYGHLELLDDAGEPVTRAGTMGEIVGTSFDNRVMPFVRYRTGDMAILGSTPHARLPGFPVLDRIEGRRQEFLVCRDARLISINSLTTPQYDDLRDIDDLQFEQSTPGQATLRIVSEQPLSAAARARIVAAMMEKTGDGCQFGLEVVDRIARTPRGKQRMLIQHLDLRDDFSGFGDGGAESAPGAFDAHGMPGARDG